MAKIRKYVPEHFRRVTESEIVSRLRESKEFNFINYKNFKPFLSGPNSVFRGSSSIFPTGFKLWDDHLVIISPVDYHLVQNSIDGIDYDPFNIDTIQDQLVKIIGCLPSLAVRKASKDRGFSATYDYLTEKNRNGVIYGDIQRTVLIIRPKTILENSP